MNKIEIAKFVPSGLAVSSITGKEIFELLKSYIENKEKTVIDFKDVNLTTSAFLNASIGNLYFHFNSETIAEYLNVSNMQPDDLNILSIVIKNAVIRFNKLRENIVEEPESDYGDNEIE